MGIESVAAPETVRAGGPESVAMPALPRYGASATATAAVDMLTRALALELRDRDITVNGISVDVEEPSSDGRVDVIAYFLSDEGHGVTGHVIHLDDSPAAGAGRLDSLDLWRSAR
ncbi:hypothetical protein ACQPZX_14290 [Actinoplanes sp. CA-142083]|uniref:hypothetical protein n=1 Tax=Actinoplanes sp. CA-142083 TaxID=3239903 RepID=UPI003D8B9720